MANRGYQKRGFHSGRRQHSNPRPRYQPLPPIPLPPRPGQSELTFHCSSPPGDYQQEPYGKGRYNYGSSSSLRAGRRKGSYNKVWRCLFICLLLYCLFVCLLIYLFVYLFV